MSDLAGPSRGSYLAAMFTADRLSQLPPYLFVEIDRRKRAAIAAGRDVIDFGVGDPDQPTFPFIVDAMAEAIRRPPNHRYPLGLGLPAYREAVCAHMAQRYGVQLDPATEALALIGSKEGLGHLPLAVLNPGEVALIPEPGYPVYTSATLFAGGECHYMALKSESGWLPRLKDVPPDVCRRARLMFLNYPNNPTGACAPRAFLQEALTFARSNNLLLVQDAAYAETFYGERPPSVLELDGAKDHAVEIHSFSKTFNMTGWRIGFAVGNRHALAALAKVKNNVDSGVFAAVQEAATVAIQGIDRPELRRQMEMYRRRRDVLVGELQKAGWPVEPPPATFYLWAKPPARVESMDAVTRILDEADVVTIPGIGFGPSGEGHVRFALTVSEERTLEAARRIARMRW